ncbi:MAG: LLM class flavin-dependent oxidoreductase [Actinomycetota bacterium]
MSEIRVGVSAAEEMLRGPLDVRRERFGRLEDAGIDHVFVPDHVSFHTGIGMDGLIQAATAAALSERLQVHIGVYLLALRHPVPVARQIASVCESAPGRLVLGVGVGGEDRHEFEVCGVDPATRGRRTDESLEALRGLLGGAPTSFAGDFFEFEEALIVPAPDPAVPILVGGRAPAALTRTARFADGWLGIWSTADRYARTIESVEAQAEAAGRSEVEWQHGLQLWVGIDEDVDRGRAHLARRMEGFYRVPYERFERYSPVGTPAAIAEYLRPYAEAGCRIFNVMAVSPSTDAAIDGVAEVRRVLRA